MMQQFAFWVLVLYGFERTLETFWKRETVKGQVIAPYTLYLLVGTHILVFFAVMAEWSCWQNPNYSLVLVIGGLTILCGATIVRNLAIHSLGIYHSIQIEIRDKHQLVTSGPYHYTRNPYYLSNAVEILAFPLVANAQISMLLAVCLYLPALCLRLVLEERALENKFAGLFLDYKSRVPRVLPKLC
jgi:protein-S-isoprenylcysteine O-methyltransferase Ste14